MHFLVLICGKFTRAQLAHQIFFIFFFDIWGRGEAISTQKLFLISVRIFKDYSSSQFLRISISKANSGATTISS
jgi:hypothetical protein